MKLRVFAVVVAGALLTASALAQSVFSAKLKGLAETPIVVSGATGQAKVTISQDETRIDFELTYSNLEGSTNQDPTTHLNRTVTQAHIHVGRPTVVGGVSVFFCATPPITAPQNGGQAAVACPASGTVTGFWTAKDVVGPASQGIEANNPNREDAFARLVKAIKSGLSYANVHTSRSPAGEIRGQLKRDHDRDHDRDDDDD